MVGDNAKNDENEAESKVQFLFKRDRVVMFTEKCLFRGRQADVPERHSLAIINRESLLGSRLSAGRVAVSRRKRK